MACGCPPLKVTSSAPSSFFHEKAGSAARPVRKNPSISLTWAKWTAAGVSLLSSDAKPWLRADWTTCAEPSFRAAIAETPGGEIDHSRS
jgi:hypothetical protein